MELREEFETWLLTDYKNDLYGAFEAGWNRRTSPASVPEGYAIVPVEPTPEMLDCFIGATGARGRFEDMLSAAPTPPSTEDRKEAERFRDGWTHSCNVLCMEIALWIDRCPHCGRPAPKSPAMQEDKP